MKVKYYKYFVVVCCLQAKSCYIHTAEEGKKKKNKFFVCLEKNEPRKEGTAQGTFITLLPVGEHQY
jgi:hypothetical protein